MMRLGQHHLTAIDCQPVSPQQFQWEIRLFFFAPRGVGADVRFICQGNFEMGQIYFDDPAVGAHSFQFDQSGKFDYAVANLTGNSYVVSVTLK